MAAATTYIAVMTRSGVPVTVQLGMGEGHPRKYAIADMRDRWHCLAIVTSRRSQERADRAARKLLVSRWPHLAPLYSPDADTGR